MFSKKVQKVIEQLEAKVKYDKRMPSIKSIRNLLEELGIEYDFNETQNCYDVGSASNNYCSYHGKGKEGYCLDFEVDGERIMMDTSDSYYSWNTYRYAKDLLKLII